MPTIQKTDQKLMRKNNVNLLLSTLLSVKEASRFHLAEKTGISIMSIGRIADELMALGLLLERTPTVKRQNIAGRPPKVLSFNTGQLLCCTVYLDWRSLCLGIVDPYGKIYDQSKLTFHDDQPFTPKNVLPWMVECILAFLEKWRGQGLLCNIGVVVPGIVDIENGIMCFSANLKWRDCQITAYLKEQLPEFNFYLENDIKALARAEHQLGIMADTQNMVILSLGNGIGSAAILNGHVYRAANDIAGEIGHIVLNPTGKICECGQVGCLQTNLARNAILNEAYTVYPGISFEELFVRAKGGDAFAVALAKQVVDFTSIAINMLANTYAPDVILLSGSSIWDSEILRRMIEQNYKSRLNAYIRDTLQLKLDSFGPDGYLIGGGVVAFQQALESLPLKWI